MGTFYIREILNAIHIYICSYPVGVRQGLTDIIKVVNEYDKMKEGRTEIAAASGPYI